MARAEEERTDETNITYRLRVKRAWCARHGSGRRRTVVIVSVRVLYLVVGYGIEVVVVTVIHTLSVIVWSETETIVVGTG